MKVKDIKPVLERYNKIFKGIQTLEQILRDDKKLNDELSKLIGNEFDAETIVREARMIYYEEILDIEKAIDNAEISQEYYQKNIRSN